MKLLTRLFVSIWPIWLVVIAAGLYAVGVGQ